MTKDSLKIVKSEPDDHWNSTESSVEDLATFREAAARTGQKERNVRLWVDEGKVDAVPDPKSKPDAKIQKQLVVMKSLEAFVKDRPKEGKETLPIPTVVFQEIQLLTHQLIAESQGHAVEKTKAEFLREQVQNKNAAIQEVKADIQEVKAERDRLAEENERLAAQLEAAKTTPTVEPQAHEKPWWYLW